MTITNKNTQIIDEEMTDKLGQVVFTGSTGAQGMDWLSTGMSLLGGGGSSAQLPAGAPVSSGGVTLNSSGWSSGGGDNHSSAAGDNQTYLWLIGGVFLGVLLMKAVK